MAGDKTKAYVERIMARAKELHDSDAFAPPTKESSDSSTAALAKQVTEASARNSKRWVAGFSALCVLLAAFSLLLPYYGINVMGAGGEIYSPAEVVECYRVWFNATVVPLFDPSSAGRASSAIAAFSEEYGDGAYALIINRAIVTLIVAGCGILLAVSGLLFQASFRNPLATPSMLGVSDGVTLGCIVFAMLGNASISDDPSLYLGLVYGLGALTVFAVLFLSRAMSGGARYNVLDMLLLGTVVCQLLGGVNAFVQNFVMDYNTWYNFYDVQQAGDALRDPVVQLVILVAFVGTVVPALLLRFKLTMDSFSDEEGTMMGVRSGLLRAGALVLGSAMQLAAIASIGQVAMVSLAVPFLVRYMMPADFRSQLLGNCLVGMAMLLACIAIQHFAVIGAVTVPVGTIVSVFIVPFFVWMIALGRGRW